MERGEVTRYKCSFWALLLLVVCMSGCSFGQQPVIKEGSPVATRTPVSTKAASSSLEACATNSATQFYQNIQRHQLKRAYAYIDPQGRTEEGQKLTYANFTQQVQMGGTSGGQFSIETGGYQPHMAEVTMTISNRQFRYHSHLQFRSEGGTCKIVQIDRV